jgi:hypothetical protein
MHVFSKQYIVEYNRIGYNRIPIVLAFSEDTAQYNINVIISYTAREQMAEDDSLCKPSP